MQCAILPLLCAFNGERMLHSSLTVNLGMRWVLKYFALGLIRKIYVNVHTLLIYKKKNLKWFYMVYSYYDMCFMFLITGKDLFDSPLQVYIALFFRSYTNIFKYNKNKSVPSYSASITHDTGVFH